MAASRLAAPAALWALAGGAGPDTVSGVHGMVSTTNGYATRAAVEILEAGGNIFDAAVTAQLALGVVEPQHVSLFGGGGLVYRQPDDAVQFIDFREEAPKDYHPKTFCDNHKCLFDPNCYCPGPVAEDERCVGGHAVGVPGVPAMILKLFREGLLSKSLEDLAQPAIKLAQNGFSMYQSLFDTIQSKAKYLQRNENAMGIFLDDAGTAPKVNVGQAFKQPDLANTLQNYFSSEQGLARVYNGPDLSNDIIIAANTAINMETEKHGVLNQGDLEGYEAVRREPVTVSFKAFGSSQRFNISGAAEPFSGPSALSLSLAYFQRLGRRESGEVARLSYLLDAQNAALADANKYMGDADFVDSCVSSLLQQDYVEARIEELWPSDDPERSPSAPIAAGAPQCAEAYRPSSRLQEAPGVAGHVVVATEDGATLSLATSVSTPMGSCVAVHGVLLNNALCDFDAVGFLEDAEGNLNLTANAPEGRREYRRTAIDSAHATMGGKRPRSAMSPVIVESSSGTFSVLALGAAGDSASLGASSHVLRKVMDGAFQDAASLQEVLDSARALSVNGLNGRTALLEQDLWQSESLKQELQGYGQQLDQLGQSRPYGSEVAGAVEAVMVSSLDGHRQFYGAADSTRMQESNADKPYWTVQNRSFFV